MTGYPHRMPDHSSGPCRYCGTTSYLADENSPVHACCLAWRKVIEAGYRCPSCQVAQIAAKQDPRKPVRLPGLPPLPKTLPDGSPFVPEPLTRPGESSPGHGAPAGVEAENEPEAQP